MKTYKLVGEELDLAVAKCEKIELFQGNYNRLLVNGRMSKNQAMLAPYRPSTDWALGGQIIEREVIDLKFWIADNLWEANMDNLFFEYGDTPLIAAMRCYVASKLGDVML